MSNYNLEDARNVAVQIAERAKTDMAFRLQLVQHPEETLKSSGLPEEAIPAFLQETKLGDVSGHVHAAGCFAWSLCQATIGWQ